MSEMSLNEQINAINEVIEYYGQVERDIKYLNEKVSEKLTFLSQNGLRTEITEMVKSTYMGHINDEMSKMLGQMKSQDMVYLEEVREHLIRTGAER
jgi:hypothetical protein